MRSTACKDRMHDVCRGYTDGYETYRCECKCHGGPPPSPPSGWVTAQ